MLFRSRHRVFAAGFSYLLSVPPAIAVATVVVAANRCRCVGFVVVVVVVVVVDVVVVVIVVVVVVVVVVFIVFVVLVVLFIVLVVVIVVFVVFVIVIVVVVFVVLYELLSPPPPCLRCRFELIVVCAPPAITVATVVVAAGRCRCHCRRRHNNHVARHKERLCEVGSKVR